MDLAKATDEQLKQLIDNRWNSAESLWTIVEKVYKRNTAMYDMEYEDKDRVPDYIKRIKVHQFKVRANRIFTDMEAVINSLIANPPKPNIIPGRDTPESKDLAQLQEQYFINRYNELNVKETLRKGLRNLYFGRLIVLKPFWNSKINDFDIVAVDPRKVRFAKYSTKEQDSEFAIEEISDTIEAVIAKFPKKKDDIMRKSGLSKDQIAIRNPEIKYKECWIKDRVIFKYEDIILDNIPNPYWDWDGLLVTDEEQNQLADLSSNPEGNPQQRKDMLDQIRQAQPERQAANASAVKPGQATDNQDQTNPMPTQAGDLEPQTVNQSQPQTKAAYFFNHFNYPRKPYIFATIFNNKNRPIGRTDMISQAIPLQEAVDRRKRQLDENAEMMNGIIKVDSEVMSKEDAQKLRYETTGIIYGKGVATGVAREVGQPLPQFIYEDMQDSRSEIDNIMAATSAFRGEREGQETKAGRLALVEQSFLRLNELVQVVDFVNQEAFNWFYQLAKVRYTETHYAKTLGDANAVKIMELQQDDFEDGTEVRIIPGKTLPEDKEFKFEQAQADVQKGIISPVDYLKTVGYNSPSEVAKNAVIYHLNPPYAVGLTPEEMQQIQPPQQQPPPDLPKLAINYKDMSPEGKIQMAAQAGIQLSPDHLMSHEIANSPLHPGLQQANPPASANGQLDQTAPPSQPPQ